MKLYKLILIIFIANSTFFRGQLLGFNSRLNFSGNRLELPDLIVANIDTLPNHKSSEQIMGIANSYGDSIVLRIAPPSFIFWESVRNNGFVIKKGTEVNNLKVIATVFPIAEELTKSNTFLKDTFAGAAAYLLYGKIDKSNIKGLYSLYEANDNILGMSLLLAEFSVQAANTLGFRFVDKEVVAGQTYYYEITTKNFDKPENKAVISLVNEKKTIKEPYEFNVNAGDQALTLEWSRDYNKNNFSHYKIERSIDGKQYFPITNKPLLFSKNIDDKSHIFSYVDSLNIINNTKYYYKLYGFTSFSDQSPAALGSATPRDLTPPPPPNITSVKFDDKSYLFDIEWDFDLETITPDFAYCQVMMSREQRGNYAALSKKLGITEFNYSYDLGTSWTEEMEGRYYFRIDCYDESGNVSHSEFETSFVPDFTDPYTPDTLGGYVDSLSFVHLSWAKSSSKDVRGYWLYWGNSPNDEMALVSKDILKDTSYQYYIPEKSLNTKIYYVVRAEDNAYNRSATSQVAVVRRLDKIAPIRPAIKSIQSDSMMLKLELVLSKSDDVSYYELSRRAANNKDTSWVLVDTLRGEYQYKDFTPELNTSYQYKIRAIDFTGNKSDFSPIKTGIIKVKETDIKIEKFTAKLLPKSSQVDLTWQEKLFDKLRNEAFTFEVYRSSGQGEVKFYKTLASGINTFSDVDLESGVLYNYAVKIKLDSGRSSDLSEVKSIIIK